MIGSPTNAANKVAANQQAITHDLINPNGQHGGLIPGWNASFIGSAIYHSLLPAFTIVVTSVAGWMLQMRNVMITTIGEDYVVAAQAKGLPSRRVVFTYAARNALLPQLQGFGLAVNRRNIRIARNTQKVTDLGFKQQVIATVAQIIAGDERAAGGGEGEPVT